MYLNSGERSTEPHQQLLTVQEAAIWPCQELHSKGDLWTYLLLAWRASSPCFVGRIDEEEEEEEVGGAWDLVVAVVPSQTWPGAFGTV